MDPHRFVLPICGMKRASQPTGLPLINVPAWAQEAPPAPVGSFKPNLPQDVKRGSCLARPVVLCVDDAAAALCVSPKTVRRLAARGDLRVVRIGRLVRIPFSEIERLIAGGDAGRADLRGD